MAGRKKEIPKSAKQIAEALFSSPEDIADLNEKGEESAFSQKVQTAPNYQVSDLARSLRPKIQKRPINKKPGKLDPIRVATQPIGKNGVLWASTTTTPRELAEKNRRARRAADILQGKLTFSQPKITAPGVVPSEAYVRTPSLASLDYNSDTQTGLNIAQHVADEYFNNRPQEALDRTGNVKPSHLESELYRLNDHMAKYNIDPTLHSRAPKVHEDMDEYYNRYGVGPIDKTISEGSYQFDGNNPLRSLFEERDKLVRKLTGDSTVSRLTSFSGTYWKGERDPRNRPLARVNEQGIFGLTEIPKTENVTNPSAQPPSKTSADPRAFETRVRAAKYTPKAQPDTLPDSHEFELRNGDLWIKRSFRGQHMPQFDELVHRNTTRIPSTGKVVSIPDFQPHKYSYSADGADSYANIGGQEQSVHSAVLSHYVINKDPNTGRLTVAPHSADKTDGGLFVAHPTTGKITPVSESSVIPSPEVREAVSRGDITEGAASKWENQLRPRPSVASGPTERDLIHNLWMKHGPVSTGSGDLPPINRAKASDQIKQNWFDTTHKLAVDHFTRNNPGATIPEDKVGLVTDFLTKERKKASYKRDAKKAADLGLI
jgi:hypothetical protein